MIALQAKRRVWWLCCLHLAVNALLCGGWPSLEWGLRVHVLFGWFDGQANLVALWVALGGGRLVVRVSAALLAIGAMTALETQATYGFDLASEGGVFWLVYVWRVAVGALVAAPFVALRVRGWQLSQERAELRPAANQFSLSDLAMWTFAAAVALALLRSAVAVMPLEPTLFAAYWGYFIAFGGATATAGITAAWAALGARRLWLWIGAVCLVAVLAGWLTGDAFTPAEVRLAWSGTHVGVVLTSLLVVRSCGYRLRHRDQAAPTAE